MDGHREIALGVVSIPSNNLKTIWESRGLGYRHKTKMILFWFYEGLYDLLESIRLKMLLGSISSNISSPMDSRRSLDPL